MSNNKRGPAPKDIRDEIFGRLTATSYLNAGKWLCDCDCGATTIAHGADLRRGKVRSCGCLHQETLSAGTRPKIHDGASTPEYRSFKSMHYRCKEPSRREFKYYGGRGISVCARWESFENFLLDMGKRPIGTTLDRIDVNGNYEPANCRWATAETQSINRQKTTWIEANGERLTITKWATKLGVSAKAIRYRVDQGWSDHEVINKPFRKHKVY